MSSENAELQKVDTRPVIFSFFGWCLMHTENLRSLAIITRSPNDPWHHIACICKRFLKNPWPLLTIVFMKGLSFYIVTRQIFVECLLYTVYHVRNILVCPLRRGNRYPRGLRVAKWNKIWGLIILPIPAFVCDNYFITLGFVLCPVISLS